MLKFKLPKHRVVKIVAGTIHKLDKRTKALLCHKQSEDEYYLNPDWWNTFEDGSEVICVVQACNQNAPEILNIFKVPKSSQGLHNLEVLISKLGGMYA